MKSKPTIYETPYDVHLSYRWELLNLAPRFYIRTKHMLKFFPKNPLHIIDIGCGDGFFLKLMAEKRLRADGIDASARAIALCKKHVGQFDGSVKCCLIEEFKPRKRYDLLICGEVLEHVENDQAFLEQINRLGGMGATLILSVPLDMKLWSKADEIAGHFRRYSKSEVFSKLEKAGFSVEDYVIWGFPLARYLGPLIHKRQTKVMRDREDMGDGWKGKGLGNYKLLLKPLRYVFLFDNLFNFTEKGVDIVIKARKNMEISMCDNGAIAAGSSCGQY